MGRTSDFLGNGFVPSPRKCSDDCDLVLESFKGLRVVRVSDQTAQHCALGPWEGASPLLRTRTARGRCPDALTPAHCVPSQ